MDHSNCVTTTTSTTSSSSLQSSSAAGVIKSVGAPPSLRPGSSPLLADGKERSRSAASTPDLKQMRLSISNEPLDVEMSSPSAVWNSSSSGISSASSAPPRINHNDHCSPHSLQDLRSTTTSSASDESNASDFASPLNGRRSHSIDNGQVRVTPTPSPSFYGNITSSESTAGGLSVIPVNPGLSRQQLLSGPCPICGDRISGFHYGIFSCESCKGFFKRTVQNKKNYVCLRGGNCLVSIATRKKCPACRFEKCLSTGMKLEAIREDRTRGGRSTYQCSYTVSPQSMIACYTSSVAPMETNSNAIDHESSLYEKSRDGSMSATALLALRSTRVDESPVKFEDKDEATYVDDVVRNGTVCNPPSPPKIPQLIQQILSVEHIWHKDRNEKHAEPAAYFEPATFPAGSMSFLDEGLASLCKIADKRLYKIVKWCKSLPLFKDISTDDQIALLINSWCELLLLSCCYRSMSTPGRIRISSERSVSLAEAKAVGIGSVIERMINLTEHLAKLHLDGCEFVCLKVISLLTSDASGLQEKEKVDAYQKQILEALQTYVRSNYPDHPSKFGELLLRIPELERVCQVVKESLATKHREGDVNTFNLLTELLRGDH